MHFDDVWMFSYERMQLKFPVALRMDVILINHFSFVKYLKYLMFQNITTCLFLSYPGPGKSRFQFKI